MNSDKKERIGWYFYDWANSAFTTTVVTVFLGPYLTSIAKTAADVDGFISILGFNIYAPSYFAYLVSLSVILQVVVLPYLGAIADYTQNKKNILVISAFVGSLATSSMFFLEGSRYMLGGLLFLIANLSYGISVVMYNAYLNDIAEPKERDTISSTGWGIGYLGGGILLALNLVLLFKSSDLGLTTESAVRISLCSAGLWWGGFTIIPLIYLKKYKSKTTFNSKNSLMKVGFKQLQKTVKDSLNYPKTLLFLAAYLFYNDGVQSVIVISAQFGQEELGISMESITLAILLVQFLAFGGSFLFNAIAKKFGTKNTILLSLVIWALSVIYSYYFLYTEAGFYVLATAIALVIGGTQSLSRSLFSRVIPKNKEAEYFGLYEVSERATSWMGPFVFGFALQTTGSYRSAILSLIIFFIIGFVILFFTNIKKAIENVNKRLEAVD